MIGQQTINVANQVDEETQETMGTINGEDEYEYGFIVNATMKTDASAPNVLWVDNARLEAQPKEGYRFQYWRFADDFYIWNSETEAYENVGGQIVPDDFSYVVYAQEIMATKFHYGFVACYTDGSTSAKAIFAQNATGEVVFDFVYDDVTYEVGELVPHLSGYKVLAVYDVSHNTTDYNLPSWYRVTSQTYRADDDHYLPAFDKTIEANVPKDANGVPMDGSLQIKFEESFLGYDELTSLSCWFMPALRGNALFSPFNVASMTGLENINTLRVNNVAYMFGGHEYFFEINGSRYSTINLNGFNAAPLTNFNGMFANCLQLRSLTLDDSFSDAKPLATSKMFFNCRTLTSD